MSEQRNEFLHGLSLDELKVRKAICEKIAREAHAEGDERWHEAARQSEEIDKVIIEKMKEQRRQRGEPEPPAVTISMKRADMRSRAQRGQDRTDPFLRYIKA